MQRLALKLSKVRSSAAQRMERMLAEISARILTVMVVRLRAAVAKTHAEWQLRRRLARCMWRKMATKTGAAPDTPMLPSAPNGRPVGFRQDLGRNMNPASPHARPPPHHQCLDDIEGCPVDSPATTTRCNTR